MGHNILITQSIDGFYKRLGIGLIVFSVSYYTFLFKLQYYLSQKMGFSPFSAYICLAFIFFWVARDYKMIKVLIIYQVILTIIIPFINIIFQNGNQPLSIILSLHDRVYKIIFLISSFILMFNKSIRPKE